MILFFILAVLARVHLFLQVFTDLFCIIEYSVSKLNYYVDAHRITQFFR